MTWRVRFRLNVGCLLLGASWRTCTRKFQMSRTRNSRSTGIFSSKTRKGKLSPPVSRGNPTSEYDRFQSWKPLHFFNYLAQFQILWLKDTHEQPLVHLFFVNSGCYTSPFLVQCPSILAWSSGVSAVAATRRLRISGHRFDLGECWLPTPDSEPQGASGGRNRGIVEIVQAPGCFIVLVSRKLTELTQVLLVVKHVACMHKAEQKDYRILPV